MPVPAVKLMIFFSCCSLLPFMPKVMCSVSEIFSSASRKYLGLFVVVVSQITSKSETLGEDYALPLSKIG